MSPLDDELRRVLSARSHDAPLEVDPLAGIERQAKQIRRRRTAIAVGGAVLSLAVVAAAVPAVRNGLTGNDRADRAAGTPTPEATGSGQLTVNADHPVNVYPWHRDVPAAQELRVVGAWRYLHPDVSDVHGQGLWSGTVDGLPGTVTVLQLWPQQDAGAEGARTVFALVDDNGVRIFHDQLTFFHEGRPGEPASANKDDVQRTTFETAVARTSGYDMSKEQQFWIAVTAPGITSVQLSVGQGATLDTTSGGGGAMLEGLSGAITTVRGRETAYEGSVEEQPISLTAGDPLTWPTQGIDVSERGSLGETVYDESHAALLAQFSDLTATNVLGITRDREGVVALVIGEYAHHGYGPNDAAYVVGAWVKPNGGPAQLVGTHDEPWGIESANARVPDDSSLGHGLVLAAGGPGWGVEYTNSSNASSSDPFVPYLAVPPLEGKEQNIVSSGRTIRGSATLIHVLGRGLTFPDI